MISQDTIERIREQADIVQIIGEHVKLRRVGGDYRGPCPFHHGRNPNFSVSPKRNVYHCFKCQESGDVFTFLQKHLGLDWPGAVRMAAEKAGIEIVETDTRRDAPDAREPLWEANGAALEHFRRTLWDGEEGAAAREYLASRHVTRDVADRFGLGYAARDGAALVARLGALGYDERRLVEAGLLAQREGESTARVRFRNRLMFPIFDTGGHVTGFGGRLLGPGEPKYLNSAESAIFSKGKLLYGLNWAKQHIRKEDRVLVVEGYFDVMRLMASGIEPVVAPLGTALTEPQATLLARYTRNVFLLYDSDEAGQKATFRSGLELLRHGAAVRVVSLPDGEDPDTFVVKHGAERLEAQLAAAIDLFDRQVQILERKGWFADLHRRRRAIDKLLPTIRATADPLTRDIYIARASEASGVDKELLLREVEEPTRQKTLPAPRGGRDTAASARYDQQPPDAASGGEPPAWPGDRPAAGRFPPVDGGFRRGAPGRRGFKDRRGGDRRGEWLSNEATPRPAAAAATAAERLMTALMLADRSLVARVAERFSPDQFRDANYRDIYAALVRLGPDAMFDEIEAVLTPGAARILSRLIEHAPDMLDTASESFDVGRTLEGAFQQLQLRELDERSAVLGEALVGATGEEWARLIQELSAINRERQALGARKFGVFGNGPR